MKYLKIIALLGLLIASRQAAGQTIEDLEYYFSRIAVEPAESEMLIYNDSLTSSLLFYLQSLDDVIETDIPEVKYLGQIVPSDSLLKIFSWNIPLTADKNLYNCIIHNGKTGDNILLQSSEGMESLDNETIINSDKWYGSLYYDIEPVAKSGDMTYILLGYDPGNVSANSKVVEILHFDGQGKPLFGKMIIRVNEKMLSRMIFRYSPLATMMLRFMNDRTGIIFDHLSPASPEYKGQYRYYGPDFSYDLLQINEGELILMEDFDFKYTDGQSLQP
ncbi:MAG: hypothetical protein U5K32_10425 [Bacteroidales bacterium]|nr:hypothetical protein [Bacteroidales bacterium]